MARVAGVELPRNKRIEIGLTYVYGIGRKIALDIVAQANIPLGKKTDDLTDDEVSTIRQVLEDGHQVEGDLRRDVTGNIKRYIDIGAYRGVRHRKNLPVRGQRTKTNAHTRKGPKRTVAGRKQAPTR
jgi:small subunit ribosomal protein S13